MCGACNRISVLYPSPCEIDHDVSRLEAKVIQSVEGASFVAPCHAENEGASQVGKVGHVQPSLVLPYDPLRSVHSLAEGQQVFEKAWHRMLADGPSHESPTGNCRGNNQVRPCPVQELDVFVLAGGGDHVRLGGKTPHGQADQHARVIPIRRDQDVCCLFDYGGLEQRLGGCIPRGAQ